MAKGGAPRFTLANLPDRYREQVAAKLYPQAKPVAAEEVSEKAEKKPRKASKRTVAPIRMKKCAGGMNKTEAQFNREFLGGKGRYEAITLHLAGGDYTPDFLYVHPVSGEVFLCEVKGSYRLPTHGRSVFAFKQACSDYPMFNFIFAELDDDGKTWRLGLYRDGNEFSGIGDEASDLLACNF